MSINRRWNLNERDGRYLRTNIIEPVVNLNFGLKHLDGTTTPVGRFRLDLESLAQQKIVTRREVHGNRVFDVQIYLRGSGSFELSVSKGNSVPLSLFQTV